MKTTLRLSCDQTTTGRLRGKYCACEYKKKKSVVDIKIDIVDENTMFFLEIKKKFILFKYCLLNWKIGKDSINFFMDFYSLFYNYFPLYKLKFILFILYNDMIFYTKLDFYIK